MTTTASFGYLVRRRRRALDLTQRELAALVGCAVVTVQKIEHDERRPSKDMAALLARHLAVAPDELDAFVAAGRGERSPDRLAVPERPQARSSLPVTLTSLVGRAAELAALPELLTGSRLVTVTGPGGAGKTRVAIETGHRLAAKGIDVVFVDLAPLRDPNEVAPAVAAAVGAEPVAGAGAVPTITRALAAREVVLVVDNAEHVLEAAPVLAQVLAGTSDARLLVTSREPLRVAPEHEFRLSPLPVGGLGRAELWPVHGRSDAVTLFLDRARAAGTRFDPEDPGEIAAVAELCSRLDGLPLAIELAAARTSVLTPRAVVELLGDRLDLLEGRRRDAPARHRSLRTTIAWSHDLLEPGDATAYAALSVFAAPFGLDDAAPVLGVSEPAALDTLQSLAERNLLVVVADPDGRPRFRWLETIRADAAERLADSGGEDQARGAQLDHLAERAAATERLLFGADQPVALARFDAVHDDTVAALDWAIASGRHVDRAAATGAHAWFHWHLRGVWSSGRRRLDALATAVRGTRPAVAGRCLLGLGILAWAEGDLADAATALEDALGLLPADDRWGRAHATGLLGLTLTYQGRAADAAEPLRVSLGLFEELDDRWGIGVSRIRAAIGARARGEVDEAQRLAELALANYEATGNAWGEATARGTLAEIALDRDDLNAAGEHYAAAYDVMAETGSEWYEGLLLHGVAYLAARRGSSSAAAALLVAGDALVAGCGGRLPVVEVLVRDATLGLLERAGVTPDPELGGLLGAEARRDLVLEVCGTSG